MPNEIDDIDEMLGLSTEVSPGPVVKPATSIISTEPEESPEDFMAAAGLQNERAVPDITRPWMKHHTFKLVRTADELDQIVDAAIAAKECALDLETEGLDNRIFYDESGKPYTKHKIVGFCLSYDGKSGFYAPVRHNPNDGGPSLNLPVERAEASITRLCRAAQPVMKPEAMEKDPLSAKEWLEPPKVLLYFWNAKFDHEFLYPVTGIDWWHPESFEDGNLFHYTHFSDDKKLGLKWKAFELLRDPDNNPYEMIELKDLFPIKGTKIEFGRLSPDEPGCLKYACSDAICTYLLCTQPRSHEKRSFTLAQVRDKHLFTYRVEKQTACAGRWMERPRVRVNRDRIKAAMDENAKKRDEILAKIKNLAEAKGYFNFDPASTKVLSEFLFSDKGLNISPKPPINEASKQFKTDAETLETLVKENPGVPEVLKWIVKWREFEKLDSTYLQNMYNNVDERSEMRFQFKQTGAATGRFSAPAGEADQGMSGIPIHGIPSTSELRKCFEAREGYTMLKADYAGQELRIAANVSNEMVWIKEFLEGDGDLHTITARAFFPEFDKESKDRQKELRKMGKIANFALLYGGGPAAIMRATGCDKLEASRRKGAFDKAVPTFANWIKGQHVKVRKDKGVYTALQRWVAIPDIDNPDKAVQAACERKSTNFPIQGTGADIMKISLVLLCKEFYKHGWLKQGGGDDSVRMLLTVHDEIVFEIKHARVQEALAVIVRVMASPSGLARPPYSPVWRVPLIVEPLIGTTWAGEYDYGMLMHGKPYSGKKNYAGKNKKYENKTTQWSEGAWLHFEGCEGAANCDCGISKDIEIVVGDRIYHRVPAWLEGLFIPGWQGGGHEPPKNGGDTNGAAGHAVSAPVSTVEDVSIQVAPTPEAPRPPPSPRMETPKTTIKRDDVASTSIVWMKVSVLTRQTVRQVRSACSDASDPDMGKILFLTDAVGNILIDPGLQVKVMPERLASLLRDLNLSDGAIYPYPRA
jgi:DNA polymerase I-like protein with 3'-5' exonuclease and polymerase domains